MPNILAGTRILETALEMVLQSKDGTGNNNGISRRLRLRDNIRNTFAFIDLNKI